MVVLSTCNRLEVYAYGNTPADPAASNYPNVRNIAQDPYRWLLNWISQTRQLSPSEFQRSLYYYQGSEAVHHLFRVAAGLDSVVLGEPQILGQVAEAFRIAESQRAAGHILSVLFRTAIHAGKRVRTETGISRNPASMSSMAIHLAEQKIGSLAEKRILIVGAGEMSRLAGEALYARGIRGVTVTNRTYAHAEELANRWGYPAVPFAQLPACLADSDLVISSTSAPQLIIDSGLVARTMQDRPDRPLALIDIAVPRDVDPAARQVPNVFLVDLDDLQGFVHQARLERERETPRVETILQEEASAFLEWLDLVPLIGALHKKAEAIRQREVERTLHRLPDLDPETRQHILMLTQSLVRKILHEPTLRLREEAGRGRLAEYGSALCVLFGLPEDEWCQDHANGGEPHPPQA
jgi:glutamyl-tRNA reductase